MGGRKHVSLGSLIMVVEAEQLVCAATFDFMTDGFWYESGGIVRFLSQDGIAGIKKNVKSQPGSWRLATFSCPLTRQEIVLGALKIVSDAIVLHQTLNERDLQSIILKSVQNQFSDRTVATYADQYQRQHSATEEGQTQIALLDELFEKGEPNITDELIKELDREIAATVKLADDTLDPVRALSDFGVIAIQDDGKIEGHLRFTGMFPALIDEFLAVVEKLLTFDFAVSSGLSADVFHSIYLEESNLTELPKSLTKFSTNIFELKLDRNELFQPSPELLKTFPNLTSLSCSQNQYKDSADLELALKTRLLKSGNTGYFVGPTGKFVAVASVSYFEKKWVPNLTGNPDILTVSLITPTLKNKIEGDYLPTDTWRYYLDIPDPIKGTSFSKIDGVELTI